MATRTVSNTGGNWSATAAWVGGVVPIAGDAVNFTATSGNLTVNVSTANLIGITFATYVGTITFNNNINTSGTVNLGTGGYTQAGASGLNLIGTTTLTSGGVTWSRTLTFAGTSITYTLSANWTNTGTVTFGGTTATTINGNTLNIGGNLTSTTTAIVSGTTVINFNGTGTWSNSSTGVIRNNLTVNTAGTLTISGTVYYNTGILTYTAGTVVTTGSTLNIIASTTLNTNGISWNNISTSTSLTITLGSNLTLTGTLTVGTVGVATLSFVLGGFNIISSSANLSVANSNTFTVPQNLIFTNVILDAVTILNGNQISILGNLTKNTTSTTTGTTTLVLAGTGTWSNGSTGAIRNNLTINTAGTITISGTVYYDIGTLTYTAGTLVTAGSTLNIGAATTLNTNGIIWNNINTTTGVVITLGSNLTLTGTLSLGNAVTSFVLGGFNLISINANLTMQGTNSTFTMPANQTFKTLTVVGTATLNGNTLTITENLTINASLGGTTSIIYAGTGSWSALNAGCLISNILTINTAGILTISGIVYKASGLFTYTAGTIDDTTGTVAVQSLTLNLSGFTFRKLLVNNTITLSSNINATTFGTWGSNNTGFILAGNTLNFTHLEIGNLGITTLPTNWVCQDIEFTSISSGVLSGNSITINGNILQSGSGSYSGTTSFTYTGTGSWTASSTSYFSNNFTINTTGTLTFISANIGGGIFTYTAGTIITTGSTLTIRATSTTMNHGNIVWHDVTIGTPGSNTVNLNNKLVCLGTLTLGVTINIFSGTDGTFDTYMLVLRTDGASNPRTTTLLSTKTYRVRQSLTCTQATNAFMVLLRSSITASQAIFTVDPGATIDVGFVNATDIDSSLGKKIYSYKGIFSNTLNWELLPTDPLTERVSVFIN